MHQISREASLSAEADWTPLDVPALYDPARSYVSGDANGRRLRVRYFRRRQEGEMLGKAWFGPGCEGPPGHAHGGSICALMDEAMGGCAWMNGHTVVAAQVTVNFRRPLPLGTEAWFRAFIEHIKGRKVFARGLLTTPHEREIFAEADGLFVVIDPDRIKSEDPRVKALFDQTRDRGRRG
jgi:acyl-coenzyme A thioesterase PaaI-like protein